MSDAPEKSRHLTPTPFDHHKEQTVPTGAGGTESTIASRTFHSLLPTPYSPERSRATR